MKKRNKIILSILAAIFGSIILLVATYFAYFFFVFLPEHEISFTDEAKTFSSIKYEVFSRDQGCYWQLFLEWDGSVPFYYYADDNGVENIYANDRMPYPPNKDITTMLISFTRPTSAAVFVFEDGLRLVLKMEKIITINPGQRVVINDNLLQNNISTCSGYGRTGEECIENLYTPVREAYLKNR
jgi:hypothetical protein